MSGNDVFECKKISPILFVTSTIRMWFSMCFVYLDVTILWIHARKGLILVSFGELTWGLLNLDTLGENTQETKIFFIMFLDVGILQILAREGLKILIP